MTRPKYQHLTFYKKFFQKRQIFPSAVATCSIVMHIHDELVIEANPRMSLDAVCEQMGRTPPWADGLILDAAGYVTEFYKKD